VERGATVKEVKKEERKISKRYLRERQDLQNRIVEVVPAEDDSVKICAI
jgi:hypothetical protein